MGNDKDSGPPSECQSKLQRIERRQPRLAHSGGDGDEGAGVAGLANRLQGIQSPPLPWSRREALQAVIDRRGFGAVRLGRPHTLGIAVDQRRG